MSHAALHHMMYILYCVKQNYLYNAFHNNNYEYIANPHKLKAKIKIMAFVLTVAGHTLSALTIHHTHTCSYIYSFIPLLKG